VCHTFRESPDGKIVNDQLGTTPEVQVTAVGSRRDRAAFFAMAGLVQGADPNWIAPLSMERRHQWSPRHPFFEHAEAQAFIARRGVTVVGSISAQIDSLASRQDGRRVGYFGQLEAINDPEVFSALLTAARDWLRQRDCGLMQGPFDLGINQACGLLIEGRDSPPMVMMGHAPAWYADQLEALGMTRAVDLFAYLLRPDFDPPPAMERLTRRLGQRLTLRAMDFSRYDDELLLLRSIFNDAWSNNWGFVPLTEAEFRAMGRELRQIIRPAYTCVAEIDGQSAGFIIALPNINELIADLDGSLLPFGWARLLWRLKRGKATTARVPLMGVRQAFQRGPLGATISFGMIDQVRHALAADGIKQVELSWILESNQGMNALIEAMGGRLYKRYRLYQQMID